MLTSIDPVPPRLAGHHLQHKLGTAACGAHEDMLLWHGWMKGTLKQQWAEERIRERFEGIMREQKASLQWSGSMAAGNSIFRSHVENVAVNENVRGGHLFLLAKPNRWLCSLSHPPRNMRLAPLSRLPHGPSGGLVQTPLSPPGRHGSIFIVSIGVNYGAVAGLLRHLVLIRLRYPRVALQLNHRNN